MNGPITADHVLELLAQKRGLFEGPWTLTALGHAHWGAPYCTDDETRLSDLLDVMIERGLVVSDRASRPWYKLPGGEYWKRAVMQP